MSLITVFVSLITAKQNTLFLFAENGLLSGIALLKQVRFWLFIGMKTFVKVGETILSVIYPSLCPECVFSFGSDVFVISG